jgi:hypothetical protein
MDPHLSEIEKADVEQVFREGGCLEWDQVIGEEGYGGGYVCFFGRKRLFASGGRDSFRALYQQALALRPQLTSKEIARRLIDVMSHTPHGSKKLAEMAGIEFSDIVKAVLWKLHELGKIQKIVSGDTGKVRWAL